MKSHSMYVRGSFPKEFLYYVIVGIGILSYKCYIFYPILECYALQHLLKWSFRYMHSHLY